jgi:hypothetical protein
VAAPDRTNVATAAAALGHGMVFVGFLQPWVSGQFGARDRLSGLDLARITDGLIDYGLSGEALTLPITRFVLFALPVAAANALLLLALGRLGLIAPAHARHVALALAVFVALVTLVAHALLLLATADDGVVEGPAFGIFVMTAGALIAVGAWLIAHGRTQPATQPSTGG